MKKQSRMEAFRAIVKQSLFQNKNQEEAPKFEKQIKVKRSYSNQNMVQSLTQQNNKTNSPTKHHFKFNENYEMCETLGQGANGLVKLCIKKSKSSQQLNFGHIQTKYAVKILPNSDDPELINTVIQTFHINRSLNSLPNVIKVLDLFIDEVEKVSYQVMEYCDWQTLEYFMDKNLTLKQIKAIMIQLGQTLKEIHHKGICHRDIKPDNILVKMGEVIEIKLIDFGVSKKFFQKNKNGKCIHEMWTRTGTILYQAPEIFLCGKYNEKIDIWACGIILYQLLLNKFPYSQETIIDTIEMITEDDYTPWIQNGFQTLNYLKQDILKRLLQKDPEKRLSAEEFLLHPWLYTVSKQSDRKVQDDSQLQKQENTKIKDLKIATCLQLSDLFNPLKRNNSPMYLNPMQSFTNLMKDDNQDVNNHIYYCQKNKFSKKHLQLNSFLVKSKNMLSGRSSYIDGDNSPTLNSRQSQLLLEEDETMEDLPPRIESRYLDSFRQLSK